MDTDCDCIITNWRAIWRQRQPVVHINQGTLCDTGGSIGFGLVVPVLGCRRDTFRGTHLVVQLLRQQTFNRFDSPFERFDGIVALYDFAT